nr:LOW QUALITY PROTEIN: WD repeat-containing protein 43-like [Cherax quadricarinatus]
MASVKLMNFSPTGEKFAHSGPDGILRIWNTISGILEHEYQPSEHLTATTTCVRYSPQKEKKKAAVKSLEASEGNLLAMGTLAGNILIYSPEKREIVATLDHAPPHAVLDITWHTTERLYSLAANNTLVEWDVTSGEKIVSVEVNGGGAICALTKKLFCVTSRSIEVIALLRKSGTVNLKNSYTGHTSLVTQLLPLLVKDAPTRYVISSSQEDRFIYAWDLLSENEEPAGSFMVKDIIGTVAVSALQEGAVTLSATTRTGTLVLFTQHLNGYVLLLMFCMERQPFLLLNLLGLIIVIFYSSISDLSGDKEIIRSDPSATAARKPTALAKIVTPLMTKDTFIKGPGYVDVEPTSKVKRKHGDPDGIAALPMEERLNALAIDKTKTGDATQPPKADNVAHLLLQGLHSKDQRILQSVIDHGDKDTIDNTVRRLPTPAIVPLLKHLQLVIRGKGHKNFLYVRWVRSILYHHMSLLSTLPNRVELLQPFYAVSASRMSTLHQLTRLHARLDLLLMHVTRRHQEIKEAAVEPEALLVYKEDPSDEEDIMEATLGISESEDNWDDLSNFGEVNGHTDEDSDMEVDQQISSVKRKLEGEEEDVSESEEENDDSDLIVEEDDDNSD